MGIITTSLVIDFDAGEGEGILKAEIDDREDGFNNGNTSFVPGDSPAFLLYKSTNVTVTSIIASLGAVSTIGSGSKAIDENVTFANEREATPGYPISSGFTSFWLGTNGGVVTATESKVTIPAPAVAALHIEYVSNFVAYRLTGVPLSVGGLTTFPVVIYISGVVA